jgi:2'-5' RNA ligase
VFFPHITLLSPKNALRDSASDIQAALERAVQSTPHRGPMEMTLNAPAPGTFYYQCVLAPVEPTERLSALRAATEEECNDHPKVFFPHLSLLYGDLADERKAEICAEAAKRVAFPVKITVKEAVVVDANGTAEEWKVVARVKL